MTELLQNVFAIEMPKDCKQPYILSSANGNHQGLFFVRHGNISPPWIVLPDDAFDLAQQRAADPSNIVIL